MTVSVGQRVGSISSSRPVARACLASLLLFAGLLVGCESMNPGDDDIALSGEEIITLISGNTFRGAWEGQQLTMVFYENGVIRGTHGLTGSDRGTWTVEDDIYCHQWTNYFGSTRRCYRWWRRESDYLLQNVDAFRINNLAGTIEQGKPPGF